MSLFSKLFSKPKLQNKNINKEDLSFLENFTNNGADFYENKLIFYKNSKKIIKYILLDKRSGVVLFNFFNFSFNDLKGVTASKAQGNHQAQIQTDNEKSIITYKFDEKFNKQIAPIHSILICPNLSEKEFDSLDESFHNLIPKNLTIFKDATSQDYEDLIYFEKEATYDTQLIKKALFFEFNLSDKKAILNKDQETCILEPIENKLLVHGVPGSGKSSILVAKAMLQKIQNPNIKLIFFSQQACSVHQLKSIIFEFIENTNLQINLTDIEVSSFDSIYKRSKNREKYDLIVCDGVNHNDLEALESMLNTNAKLLLSSNNAIENISTCRLTKSYRISETLTKACLGESVENLNTNLSFKYGNIFMDTHLTLATLLKEVDKTAISIIHYDKEELLELQAQINEYFENISYMHDDIEKKDGIFLYPLSKIRCINNDYLIIVVDKESLYEEIELISRANIKTFVLSRDKSVYQILNQIKNKQGNENESS